MFKTLPTILLTTLAGAQSLPSDADILKLLVNRIDVKRKTFSMVVGIITPEGKRIVSHGGVDGDTVFEIGSLTKIFTTLLLSDMVLKGEVALNDPLEKYLPPGTKTPEYNGRSIQL